MFDRMKPSKKSQAFLVLFVLACQLVLPSWHILSHPHANSTSGLSQLKYTSLQELEYQTPEDVGECAVCQSLARTTSLAFIPISHASVHQPFLQSFTLTEQLSFANLAQRSPPQRGPPIIS
jgi:hypothetical protein